MTQFAAPNAMDLATLVNTLERWRAAYYNQTPEVSDAVFDQYEDHLRSVDPSHPYLLKIGAPAPTGGVWPTAKHGQPMTSLNKAQTPSEFSDWCAEVSATKHGVFCSHKYDGISLSMRYERGYLVQALTRGDGLVGVDITRNVRLMKGAVKQVPKGASGFVRCEVVCCHDDFAAHFKGESNPRSTASGTAKRQSDYGKCAHLTLYAYRWLPDDGMLDTKEEELTWLKKAGFHTSLGVVVNSIPEAMAIYDEHVASARAALNYEIDGLVFEINGNETAEAMGLKGSNPKAGIAFKFPHETAVSTLRAIHWQMSNGGRDTPVAEFDPVTLIGTNVSRATLHNLGNISDLWGGKTPRVGDIIEVSKRGDVIPGVEAVVSTTGQGAVLDTPTECPSCKAKLELDGAYLVCVNDDCPAQAVGSIKRWVKKIGVLYVGDALIEAWVREGLIEDAADLYLMDDIEASQVTMSGRVAGGSATKAINALNNKKLLPLHVIVGSLGIPLIGRSMAKMVVDGGFDTPSKMLKARISEIAVIPGMGQTKAAAFVKGFRARAGLLNKLLAEADIQIQTISGPLVGKTFCLTGFRDAALQSAIEAAGGTVKSSVSKSLSYLVALDANSQSGKAVKARSYGTQVIDPDMAWMLTGQAKPV